MHIDRFGFGSIRIDGVDYRKDLVILGGVIHCPWWRSAGGHVFAVADLEHVIAAAPDAICLGTGAIGMVKVEDELIRTFEAAGTEVHVDRTGSVVEVFNRLAAERRNVAAALHLTC